MEQEANNTAAAEPQYLQELNPQQRDAVLYCDGPQLVIAGAGSGKTRVLTYKIVHLLAHGYEPYRIMALTFTNKAAREMKERIALVAPKQAPRLWMGTFHSIFLRILRNHADKIGYKPGFTIYDANDSKTLIKNIIKERGLDEKVYKPQTIANIISGAKNSMMSPAVYDADNRCHELDIHFKRPETASIYRIYADRCKVANAMDFDDILFYMNVLLRDNPDILRHYQEFFRYILVDEYQDTNFAQHLIISQLSRLTGNICVVGDDAQSIYSFRGANINNILGLERQYQGLKVFKLERNYRSTRNIIDAAGSLIKHNRNQMPKEVYSENEKGAPIEVVKAYSDLEESYLVANRISQTKLTNHDSYDDFAVLYRTNAQSRILEESLRKRSIPYRIYGGLSFYQRKEVRDAVAYFRLTVNPADDEALRRIINFPARGIGDTTLKKLQSLAIEKGVPMLEAIDRLEELGLNVNKGTARKLHDFADMMAVFTGEFNGGSNAFELAQLIFNRTGLLSMLIHDNTPEAISRQENLTELLGGLKEFVDQRLESGEENVSMTDFLSEVQLATDQDTEADDAADGEKERVTLMTVHAAKGLEFKNIFVVGVEEDLFPSSMAADSPEQIEEERRLLYVAITRAKKLCFLSYASSRYRNGQTMLTRPSRFLGEIDRKYLSIKDSSGIGEDRGGFVNPLDNYRASGGFHTGFKGGYGSGKRNPFSSDRPAADDRDLFRGRMEDMRRSEPADSLRTNSRRRSSSLTAETGSLRKITPSASGNASASPASAAGAPAPGTTILHERFGRGKVQKTQGTGADTMIIVDFENMGEKKLLLRFAKFTIL